jgi:hypothetical protein
MTGELIPFPDRREINEKIYHYRRAGEDFGSIAEKMEMTTSEVIKGFRSFMVEVLAEYSLHEREQIVALELSRLDQLMQPFYIAGTEGEKEGAEVYLKIAAHRAKLLRLDQPTPQELAGQTQVIVVSGSKEDFELALREGQMRQVAGRTGDDGEE